MKILKKITVKTVHGKKLDGFGEGDPIGAERVVLTAYGRADKFELGQNTLPSGDVSDYIRFRGQFAAYAGELGDGDEFRSGVMILPEVAGNLLAGLLEPEDVASVNFGFIVGIKHTETPIGYEYFATPLMESAEDTDPLAAIKGQVQAALPKPKHTKAAKKPAATPAGK